MAQTLTVRLPDEAAQEVRRIAQKERRSVSEIGARIVDEWIRQNRFVHIEFRSINGERVACLKGRLEVWQAVMVAQGYEDVRQAAQHLDLRPDQLKSALDYADAYPDEIASAIADAHQGFDRLKFMLPELESVSIASLEPKGA